MLHPILAKFIFKQKFNHDGVPVRLKSRVVVQGFHEPETGADNVAPVASMESVHPLVALAARHAFVLKQADIKTAFLHARIPSMQTPSTSYRHRGSNAPPHKLDRFGY